ncbi:LysM peptidoglycan-binding domain-containing protein [Candidimonas sp. SYP-B2681]|uniref:peptidoglycan DD-metalloendopeptidase family protein n=1 Tax=Candidimonas sp. SYP-B2681 TaxID=2497686 RepID=UPI000F87C5EE|nr:peptidoglycan DD-metalloendopeptidase family protein [Candidimonas sp. SYP-B2681]RTZ41503.1 LysM peptidoglycan-binding domain-containing protein [Candidimonas sp. SYP-B2681]
MNRVAFPSIEIPSVFASTIRSYGRCLAALSLAIVLASCGTSKPLSQGQYRVVRGDTLTQIAQKHGQSVDSLIRSNKLKDGDNIRVGQVLNVKGGSAVTSAPTPSVKGPSIAAPRSIDLVWPAEGQRKRGTSTSNTQGVYIAAAAGSPVKAAASGKVVYAGNGLRGYGNMLIVNHDANFLSVYAHNQTLLAKEGAQVKQGQTIATMGSTGSNAVNLYFELRYDGKAVDALRYLP